MSKVHADPVDIRRSRAARLSDTALFVLLLILMSMGLWFGYGEYYFKASPVFTGLLMGAMGVFSCLALRALCRPQQRSLGWGWAAVILCAGLFWIRGAAGPDAQELAGEPAGTFVSFSMGNHRSGVDVWVNDVCLGQTPLEIPLSEFKAKAKPWPHEPNENSYHYSNRYSYDSPSSGSSTAGRYEPLPGPWLGYLVRFTLNGFDGYCWNAQGGRENESGNRRVTNSTFTVEYPGRESYIRRLLNKARATDYVVDAAWLSAWDDLGVDAQEALFRAAFFDAVSQYAYTYQAMDQWPVTEPGMVTVMEQWLAWKYGWSAEMTHDQAFGILERLHETISQDTGYRQVWFETWAIKRLVPFLDAREVVDWVLPQVGSREFSLCASTYWPVGPSSQPLFSDSPARRALTLKLRTLFEMDHYLDRQGEAVVNPIEAFIVPEIIARHRVRSDALALRFAVLLDHPDMETFLKHSWQRSKRNPGRLPMLDLRFSEKDGVDPWLYLLAHLRGPAGQRFREQYADSILDMTRSLFAEDPDRWAFSALTFPDVERMDGKDTLTKRTLSLLAESLDNKNSSGNNPLWFLWNHHLRVDPLSSPESYAACWRQIADRDHQFREGLDKLAVLPPAKRQLVLNAIISEIASNPEQVRDWNNQAADIKKAEKLLEHAKAMVERSGPQGQPNHYLDRRDHLSEYQLRWLMEMRPGSVGADFYAASVNAATRLEAVTLYCAHATAYARGQLAKLTEDPDAAVSEGARAALNEVKAFAEQPVEDLKAMGFDPPASAQTLRVRHYAEVPNQSYRLIEVPMNVVWERTQTLWAQDQWRPSRETHRASGFGRGYKNPVIRFLSDLPDTGVYVIDPNDQAGVVCETLTRTCFAWDGSFDDDNLDTRYTNRDDAVFKDAEGHPVSGAEVQIRLTHKQNGSSFWLDGHVTDDQGRIPLSTVKGDYQCDAVKASHPDFSEAMRTLDFGGVGGLRLRRLESLANSRMMVGQVLDGNGVPVEGAIIKITAMKTETDSHAYGAGQYTKIPTDARGRFRFLPSGQNIPEIPPLAQYQLQVTPPEGRAMLPHVALYPNGQEITIQMAPARTRHLFRFEDAEGKVIDSQTIRPLRLELRNAEGARLTYYDAQVREGIFVPPGTLSADDSFESVVITEQSPEVIVFRQKPPRRLRGRALNVVTGEPIPNVLIVNSHGRKDDAAVAEFTEEDWDRLDQWNLSDSNHPGWGLVDRLFSEFTVARTDRQGGFSMIVPPTSTYFMSALGRALVPHRFRTQDSKMDDQRTCQFEDIHLVPSARLVLDIEGPDRPQTFHAELHVSQAKTPDWWQTHDNLSLRFPSSVRSGGKQTVLVPAFLPFSLECRTYRGPWSSIHLSDECTLKPGQVLDLGTVRSEPAVQVTARVVDTEGKPVEGMRITVRYDKTSYGVGQKRTDPEGRCSFYVNAHSQGTISAFRDYNRSSEACSARFDVDALGDDPSDIVIVWSE